MKKDIEWLKSEVEKQDIVMDKGYIYTNDLLYLIDNLDETEELSKDWIDEHKVARINNLRKMTMSDVVPVDELENLIVPKQKLPVIPKIVADWMEECIAKGFDLYRTLNVLENGASNLVEIYRWYRNNTLKFTTAYLTQKYEVDEVRYHVRVPYSKVNYYYLDNGHTGVARLFEIDANHSDFELTEDEINKYLPGISKGYWEEIK